MYQLKSLIMNRIVNNIPVQVENVKLTDLIAPSFYQLHHRILRHEATHHKLKGGRGSTKSSFVSIEIILGMMSDPKANCMALRKVGRYLEESVFEQLLWAIDALHVSHLWKVKLSPIVLIYKETGQKIIFRGADDPKKIKSTKLKNGYFKYAWYEEYDEFDGDEEIRTINQSLMRGGDKFIYFYTWNPPKSINSWVNQDILIPRKDTIVHHSTYLTVPVAWLGQVFVDEAEYLKQYKPRSYEHEYMGVAIGTGGKVFDNVELKEITNDEIYGNKQKEIPGFDRIKRGIDWGFAADPFVYGVMHFDRKHQILYIFHEVYYVNLSNAKAVEYIKQENVQNNRITADSAEPKSIAELRSNSINIRGAIKGPDSVEYGIKWLQSLNKIIIDPVRCPNAAREFSSYELERDRLGDFKGSYPDKDNHTIDMTRYACEDEMNTGSVRVLKPRDKG